MKWQRAANGAPPVQNALVVGGASPAQQALVELQPMPPVLVLPAQPGTFAISSFNPYPVKRTAQTNQLWKRRDGRNPSAL